MRCRIARATSAIPPSASSSSRKRRPTMPVVEWLACLGGRGRGAEALALRQRRVSLGRTHSTVDKVDKVDKADKTDKADDYLSTMSSASVCRTARRPGPSGTTPGRANAMTSSVCLPAA